MVTTPAAPVALETEQFWKPFVRSTVGLAGTVKTDVACGNATVTVSPVRSKPVAVEVNPTVQVARALAASVVAAKVTAVGVVAAATVGATPTEAAVMSALVLTVQLAARGDPATPAVTPRICTVAAVLTGRVQTPPLSASVIVTTPAAPVALETEQFWKPFVRSTVGLAGTVKTDVACGNATVTVSPVRSKPVAVEVNPTVHVARALAASVVAAKVTAVGVVAAATVGATPTAAAVMSPLVLTVQLAAVGEPATPAVTPRICTLAAVLTGRVQTPPSSASVIVTTPAAPVALETEQFWKPFARTPVGLAARVKPDVACGNATVTVSPVRSKPVAVEV